MRRVCVCVCVCLCVCVCASRLAYAIPLCSLSVLLFDVKNHILCFCSCGGMHGSMPCLLGDYRGKRDLLHVAHVRSGLCSPTDGAPRSASAAGRDPRISEMQVSPRSRPLSPAVAGEREPLTMEMSEMEKEKEFAREASRDVSPSARLPKGAPTATPSCKFPQAAAAALLHTF